MKNREQEAAADTTARLQARVAMLERALARARAEAEKREMTAAEIRQKIFGLAAAAPRALPRITAAPGGKKAHDGAPGVPVLMLSDWHVGETVRPGEALGNTFNTKTFIERVHALIANARHVVDLQWRACGPAGKPQQIVLPLLGDFVSGEIHDELARTNDLDPLPSVLTARDALRLVIFAMAEAYGNVVCPCVSGNHGRTDRKPTAKRMLWRNLDWLIYTMLQRDFAGDKRVRFAVPENNMARFDVFNVRFLAMHGHDLGVKGGDGIIGSAGPILRGRAKMAGFCEARRDPFDTLLIGHWHQHMMLPGVIVNGTLKGPDEYSVTALRARPEPPGQALFFVHQEFGVTSHWLVRVAQKSREK